LWLDTLPQATLTDIDRLTEAFKERYEISELMKFKSVKKYSLVHSRLEKVLMITQQQYAD